MDYLSLPTGASHLLVYDLGGEAFGEESLVGYDARHGWNIDSVLAGDISEGRDDWESYSQIAMAQTRAECKPSMREVETCKEFFLFFQFLQTWLFFGLLREALDRPILRKDYSTLITSEGGTNGCFVTATSFSRDFEVMVRNRGADGSWQQRLRLAWLRVLQVLNALTRSPLLRSKADMLEGLRLVDDILFSIRCLHDTIKVIHTACGSDLQRNSLVRYGALTHDDRQMNRLHTKGLCPTIYESIIGTFGQRGLYYFDRLLTNQPTYVHHHCSRVKCVEFDTNDTKYEVRHTDACAEDLQGCLEYKVRDVTKDAPVLQVINSCLDVTEESFPLISVHFSGQQTTIEFVPYESGMRYIAVSHVWSDGRGNPFTNQLPTCQLLYLHEKVTQLRDSSPYLNDYPAPMYFWIDTLCVPLSPEDKRKTALRRLSKTYGESYGVLVLTSELTSQRQPCMVEETLLRIWFSKWMTRLWTYNEAFHAPSIWVQFRDAQINFERLQEVARGTVQYSLAYEAAASFKFIDPRATTGDEDFDEEDFDDDDNANAFVAAWGSIRDRSTSKARDEAICLCQILGLDVGTLLEAAKGKEMQAFWELCPNIPGAVLWLVGPRETDLGFGWAPKSLMRSRGIGGNVPASSYGMCKLRPSGLLVRGVDGVWFGEMELPTQFPLAFGVPPKASGSIATFIGERQFLVAPVGIDGAIWSWERFRAAWQGNIALLWKDRSSQDLPVTPAVLITSCKKHGGCVYGKWLCSARVIDPDSYEKRIYDPGQQGDERYYYPALRADNPWYIV